MFCLFFGNNDRKYVYIKILLIFIVPGFAETKASYVMCQEGLASEKVVYIDVALR